MSDVADGNNILKTDTIKGMYGHLSFNNTQVDQGIGSTLTEDYSYVQLANNDNAQISLQAGGKIRTDAPSDMSINVGRNKIQNILGDSQLSVGRDNHITIDGKVSVNIGKYGSKEKEAYKKLTELASTIQKESISTAKTTTNNRIPCPVCNSKVLTQPASVAAKISSARAAELMNDVNTGWKHLIRTFKRIIWLVPDIFKKSTTASFHQKTGSCGSPDCINHTVPDLKLSLDAYSKKATDLIEQNKTQIEQLQTALGQSSGGLTLITKGTCFVSTGLYKNESVTGYEHGNHTFPTGFVAGPSGKGPALSSAGAPKRTIQVGAIRLTEGDMYLNSSEKFTVNAGAPGIALETNGPLNARGNSVEIRATDGEAHFSSGNLTVISGATVSIKGGLKTGETGIVLQSEKVHVAGGLTVQGNMITKGGGHFDGPLTAPILSVPTYAQPVTPSKPPQDVSSHGSWFPMNIVHNTLQEVLDNTQRNVPDPFYICQVRILTEYAKKWYSEVMSAIPLECTLTGWCLVTTWGTFFGTTVCGAGAGTCVAMGFTYGTDAGFCPVWNLPHNHAKYNEYHAGETVSPLMLGHDQFEGATAAGTYPSHIPIPAPTKTSLGTRPAPYSMPGPCGGGGQFIKDRNLDYGVDPLDAFNGLNYVDRGTDNGLNTYTTPGFTQFTYGFNTLSGVDTTGINNVDCK